jgi:hypothetical protein
MLKFIASVPELKKQIDNKLRRDMISHTGGIRKWEIHQGAIYSPFVGEYQQALQEMRKEITGEYIITTETGGSFLGDAVTKGTFIKNEKIQKMPRDIATGKNHKSQQPEDIVKHIHQSMKKNKNADISFTIVEPIISGGSVHGILNEMIAEKILNIYPNIKIKLVTIQETLGVNSDGVKRGLNNKVLNMNKIANANRVHINYAQTNYILGEDIPNQTKYDGKEKIIIFNAMDETMVAYQITPIENTTTRDIVIALGNGKLNGKLEGIL